MAFSVYMSVCSYMCLCEFETNTYSYISLLLGICYKQVKKIHSLIHLYFKLSIVYTYLKCKIA